MAEPVVKSSGDLDGEAMAAMGIMKNKDLGAVRGGGGNKRRSNGLFHGELALVPVSSAGACSWHTTV